MIRDKILEYPYCGKVFHVVDGMGRESDTETLLYEGVMDEHQVTDEEGTTMQTSSYIISIPWKDYCTFCGCGMTLPKKGDRIELTRYGETFELRVDNAEPSQIGGISIYATRTDW